MDFDHAFPFRSRPVTPPPPKHRAPARSPVAAGQSAGRPCPGNSGAVGTLPLRLGAVRLGRARRRPHRRRTPVRFLVPREPAIASARNFSPISASSNSCASKRPANTIGHIANARCLKPCASASTAPTSRNNYAASNRNSMPPICCNAGIIAIESRQLNRATAWPDFAGLYPATLAASAFLSVLLSSSSPVALL